MELSKKMKSIISKVQSTRLQKYAAFRDGKVFCSDEELKNQTKILKERLANGETLDDILIDAFAVVVETASRVLGKEFYDEQIAGGIVVNSGRVAEMQTGEGKTLMSVLPGYLNALSGEPVHIFTANEYLAERDACEMGKIYNFLGLSVGVIKNGQSTESKKKAYAADVTYGTSSEFGFDFLRDNLVRREELKVRRGFGYAIVDEADNVLIDDAIIPLVVSENTNSFYDKFSAEDLAESRRQAEMACEIVNSLKMGDIEIDGDYVGLSQRGQKKVQDFYGIKNLYTNFVIKFYIDNALKARFLMKEDHDYYVGDKGIVLINNNTGRSMDGMQYSYGLQQAIEAKEKAKLEASGKSATFTISEENQMRATISLQSFFRMYKKLSGMTGTAKLSEGEFQTIYGLSVEEIPTHKKIIRVDEPDVCSVSLKTKYTSICYDVLDCINRGQPVLIGTLSVKESEVLSQLFDNLDIPHTVLNAKADQEEAEIIAQAGRLGSVTIATNMAGRGTDILLGGNSEFLAKQKLREKGYNNAQVNFAALGLGDNGIVAEYLEAKKEFDEQVEKERKQVAELGGLRVIATGHNPSKRVDDQLRGRAGRQGDPGSSVIYVSADDRLIYDYLRLTQRHLDKKNLLSKNVVNDKAFERLIRNAQAYMEGINYSTRKMNLEDDIVVNYKRKIYYEQRDQVLASKSVKDLLSRVIDLYAEDLFGKFDKNGAKVEDVAQVLEEISSVNGLINQNQIQSILTTYAAQKPEKGNSQIKKVICEAIASNFSGLLGKLRRKNINIDIMKEIFIGMIDEHWVDFLTQIDHERQGVSIETLAAGNRLDLYIMRTGEIFEKILMNWRESVLAKCVGWAQETDKKTFEKIDISSRQGLFR